MVSAYTKAVFEKLPSAAYDVLFVAGLSLTPILIGRAVLLTKGNAAAGYWDFLTNGQLAFYSMGSLASLLVMCFSDIFEKSARKGIGAFCIVCLVFIAVLIGIDPTLTASSYTAFGPFILSVYIATILVKLFVDAATKVDAGQLAQASNSTTAQELEAFRKRMEAADGD